MNSQLQDQIITDIATQMQSDIDREIMWGMLQTMGWTRVLLSRFQDNHHAIDIGYWLLDNCQSAYERNGRDFLFENPKDASYFILRWGS